MIYYFSRRRQETTTCGDLDPQTRLGVKRVTPRMTLSQAVYILRDRDMWDVTSQSIRVWEREGLIRPIRDKETNHRMISYKQLDTLWAIGLLKKIGYSTYQIREYLRLPQGEARTQVTASIVKEAQRWTRIFDRTEQVLLQLSPQS